MDKIREVPHPLIDPKAAPYYDAGGTPVIVRMEEDMTIAELMAACDFMLRKYNARAGKKPTETAERDMEKAKRYGDYKAYLERMAELVGLRTATTKPVAYALKKIGVKWKY